MSPAPGRRPPITPSWKTARLRHVGTAMEVQENIDTPDSDGRRPLQHAAVAGKPERLRHLLSCGATVGAADAAGWTALHSAASAGHAAACSVLLNAGAPPNARTESGTTPLFHAAGKGHEEVVQVLLQAP